MSKKQATNTFGKGMMLDLHPLTVPSDVLTDALNATTITMNGNEGILQNDMGNGRVESAFLPPGYVPVGIKEYEGIIYVASYNPITNKSQIGSFPSPERNIDQTENDNNFGNPLKLLQEKYTRKYKCNTFNTTHEGIKLQEGLGQLTNKIEIFGDYKVLRSGDKFGFYFETDTQAENNNNIGNLSNYFSFDDPEHRHSNDNQLISNFDNLGGWDEENKVYQNNIVTLSTQVLDSNNNLRDLTGQLKRYDTNNNVIKFENSDITDDDKFNAGYFISNNKREDWDAVNKERNKKALNTYNNKLFGRLYLVGQVNVVDHIDVQLVTKSYIDESLSMYNSTLQETLPENTNILYFYIDYYYNCPSNKLHTPKLYFSYNGVIKDNISGFKRISDSTPNDEFRITRKVKSTDDTLVSNIVNACIETEVQQIETITCQDYTSGSIYNEKLAIYESEDIPKVIEEIVTENQPEDIGGEEVLVNTTEQTITTWSIEDPTYDPLTNLYKQRYFAYLVLDPNKYPLEQTSEESFSTVLNYVVIPRMKDIPGETTNPSLLTHIATEGSIDLSKIGSGECNITTWRYICTDTMVKLNWGLEDYPLDTDVITDMRMDFYDWNNASEIISDNASSSIDPEPVWYTTFNQISYNSVNTSVTFGDNTLKKRHIYLVKLSRKKNGNDELIGWRILITTSIYNDLFMMYDDYCSEEAQSDINDRNNIKITVKVSVESNTKSQSENSIQLHKLEDNEYVLCNDFSDIRNQVDDNTYSYITYTSFTTTKVLKVDLEIPEKYPFDFNNKNSIKYNINYESDITKNIEDNIINAQELPITNNTSIEDKLNEWEYVILNPQENYSGDSYITVKNNYNIPSQAIYKYGELQPITSKRKYESMYDFIERNLRSNIILFPFIGGHSDNDKGVAHFNLFSYEYDSGYMKHHIIDDIIKITGNKGIAKNLSTYKKKIDEILQSVGLEDNTFIIIGSPITFGWEDWQGNDIELGACGVKVINTINTYIDEINDTIEDNDDKIKKFSNNTSGNFMLRRDEYPYGEQYNRPQYFKLNEDSNQNTTDKRWFEKEVTGVSNPQDSANKFAWGHKDWFILLWKNKDGNFTIVNKFYAFDNEWIFKRGYIDHKTNNIGIIPNGYFKDNCRKASVLTSTDATSYPENIVGNRTNIQDWIIDKIFGINYTKNIFFKLNGQDTFTGCFIDPEQTQYNTNYTVEIEDSVHLVDIKFDQELLKYYDSELVVNSEEVNNSYSKLIIPKIIINQKKLGVNDKLNELINYLDFNLLSTEKNESLETKIYNILGMDNFISHIDTNKICEGCIKKDNKIYTLDSNGVDIIGDIYVFENGKLIISNLAENNKEFINSLMVKDNNLLIANYSTNKSQHYAFSYGDRPGGGYNSELVVKIDLPHIKYDSEENIQPVNLIFGL